LSGQSKSKKYQQMIIEHYKYKIPSLTTAHVSFHDLSPYTALPSVVFLPASVVLEQKNDKKQSTIESAYCMWKYISFTILYNKKRDLLTLCIF